jgi:flagellar FliJ protein
VTRRGRGSLGGLVRLRGVRERDSRIGLATALAEERGATATVAELERQLGTLSAPVSADLATFRARQHLVEMLGAALVDARAGQEVARQITLEARNRWVEDRSRLAAVESLVARRTAAVREERRRQENRDLDEIAGELWRRQHATTSGEAS